MTVTWTRQIPRFIQTTSTYCKDTLLFWPRNAPRMQPPLILSAELWLRGVFRWEGADSREQFLRVERGASAWPYRIETLPLQPWPVRVSPEIFVEVPGCDDRGSRMHVMLQGKHELTSANTLERRIRPRDSRSEISEWTVAKTVKTGQLPQLSKRFICMKSILPCCKGDLPCS